jgi:WD40 repeat protein
MGHRDLVNGLAFLDDRTILSISEDGTAKLWDVSSGQSLSTVITSKSPLIRLAAASQIGKVAVADAEISITVLDAKAGMRTIHLPQLQDTVISLDLSGDGTTLMATSASGSIYWTKLERELSWQKAAAGQPIAAAIASDGKIAALARPDGPIDLLDLQDGRTIASLNSHKADVTKLIFSDQGRLVSFSLDGTARLWAVDQRGGQLLITFTGFAEPLTSGIVDQSGTLIAAVSETGDIVAWRAFAGGKAIVEAARRLVAGRKLSPDEKRFFHLIGADQ